MIYACINAYNESVLLPGCLASVRQFLPKSEIILIDGAYASFCHNAKLEAAHNFEYGHTEIGNGLLRWTDPVSTDDTMDIARKSGVEHIVECGRDVSGNPVPWDNEWTKRSLFFQFGQDGDYFFIIDADERLQGTPVDFTEEHYAVWLKRDDNTGEYVVHRAFRKQTGLHMFGAHMAVWVKDRLLKKDEAPRLGGCRLLHLYIERNNKDRIRMFAKGAYYRNGLSKEEAKFRETYGI